MFNQNTLKQNNGKIKMDLSKNKTKILYTNL